jgi:hypothetical protein
MVVLLENPEQSEEQNDPVTKMYMQEIISPFRKQAFEHESSPVH